MKTRKNERRISNPGKVMEFCNFVKNPERIIIEDPEKIQCFNTFPLFLGFIALNIRISLQTYHLKNFNKATCSACTEIA